MSGVPLPKSIRILGSRTQVRVVEGLSEDDGDHRELLGQCNMDHHLIELRPLSPAIDLTTQQQTLMHEIMHAITQEAGLKFMFEGDQEEHVVNVLSVHLLAILKENRRLMQYLLGRYWL